MIHLKIQTNVEDFVITIYPNATREVRGMATNTRPDNDQVLTMLNIIASQFGATITEVNYETHWIEADCPAENKLAFATAVAETLQNVLG